MRRIDNRQGANPKRAFAEGGSARRWVAPRDCHPLAITAIAEGQVDGAALVGVPCEERLSALIGVDVAGKHQVDAGGEEQSLEMVAHQLSLVRVGYARVVEGHVCENDDPPRDRAVDAGEVGLPSRGA